ncbi:hypothetical protein LINGRAHAP2_LOCUS17915 [Linum grandiflorum]
MCHSHHNCLHQVDEVHDVDHHLIISCLRCQPESFIRLVQHLIERCLMLRMSKEQCVKSLALHASIPPLVTLTAVWRELENENMDFFMAYAYHFRSSQD